MIGGPAVPSGLEEFSRTDVAAAPLCTMAVGGIIPLLVTPRNDRELVIALHVLRASGKPFRVIGAGSNVLLPDGHAPFSLIKLGGDFKSVERLGASRYHAGAAAALMSLSREVAKQGLSGLEFAGGIPASVGGAVSMNAGAHGGEVCSVVEEVLGFWHNGEPARFNAREIRWEYRHSNLPEHFIVTGAVLNLVPGDAQTIADRTAHHLAERRARQPLQYPSSGSIFKNPSPTCSAGQVLQQAGMKGKQVGGAQISTLHANWIINPGRNASAVDVRSLIDECQKAAAASASVVLEPEVKCW